MADDTILVEAPPSSVLAVLSDPRRYEQFVVGNSGIRSFEPHWPDPGSNLHHTLGVKPFVLRDHTTSLGTDGLTYLSLLTRMGFIGATLTTFVMHADGEGTALRVREEPLWGLVAVAWNKPTDMVMHWRNRRLLARLSRLAREQFRRELSVLPAPQQAPAEQGSR